MAITNKEEGVWILDQVYNKQNEGDIWNYSSSSDPGQLWAWGSNYYGILGQNTAAPGGTDRSSPTQIGTDETWTQVHGGAFDSVGGVKADGTLWMWGRNYYGKLGLNQFGSPIPSAPFSRSSPTQVGTDTTWSTVSTFEAGTFALKTNGTLWGWGGENMWGSPQGGPAGSRSSPTQVTGNPSTTWAVGKGKLATWTQSFAVISDSGELYTWGRNYGGSLGQNQSPGNNYDDPNPQRVGTDTTWDIVGGVDEQGWKNPLALKTDGTLWAWGGGGDGQLGQNNRTPQSSPVQIPGTTWTGQFTGKANNNCHSAIKSDGTLWSWGGQNNGELGLNQATTHISSPTQVGTDSTWATIGGDHAVIGVKTDGTLWTWGSGSYGALGQNDRTTYSSPVQVPGTNWNASGVASMSNTVFSLRYS
tara:strand:+ start:484 stop:1731 length:1248 start_codon:yes stop_codon:yes gene_type:complete